MLHRIGCYPRSPRGGVPRRVGPLVARWRVPCPPSVCFSGGQSCTLFLSGAGVRDWTVSVRTCFLLLNRRSFCIWGSEGVSGAIAKPPTRVRRRGIFAQQKRSRGASVTRRDPCKGSDKKLAQSKGFERVEDPSRVQGRALAGCQGSALTGGAGGRASCRECRGQSPLPVESRGGRASSG